MLAGARTGSAGAGITGSSRASTTCISGTTLTSAVVRYIGTGVYCARGAWKIDLTASGSEFYRPELADTATDTASATLASSDRALTTSTTRAAIPSEVAVRLDDRATCRICNDASRSV